MVFDGYAGAGTGGADEEVNASPAHAFRPGLQRLLHCAGLDVAYHRAQGNYVFCRDASGTEIRVLDLVGGFGSLLLGHSHPEIIAEAHRLLNLGVPFHVQGSIRTLAVELAARLSRRAGGNYCTVFANSGAEAVEAAMKHAALESGGTAFLVLEGAFHGKTLGALQLTSNPAYRRHFPAAGFNVVRIRPNDLSSLEQAFAVTERLAGFVFEPIQGEGGVRIVAPEFIRRAAELCAQRGIPLVADECQTGLGRTGRFLASEFAGVRPDYVVLSKSLGGGIAKISACLIDRSRYQAAFDLLHTSTFADDDFSCAVALKVLDLITPHLLELARQNGAELRAGLDQLGREYPDVIAEVRGQGLLLGLEFLPRRGSASLLLRHLSDNRQLTLLLAGHLLSKYRLRIAPTLSDPFTLRLEPSVFFGSVEITATMRALSAVCERLRNDDSASLMTHLANRPRLVPLSPSESSDARHDRMILDTARAGRSSRQKSATSVGWLCHLVDSTDLLHLEPAAAAMSSVGREEFLAGFAEHSIPVVLNAVEIRSQLNMAVQFCPILLPVTSAWIRRQMNLGRSQLVSSLVQRAVQTAGDLGCQVVSLGQFTACATRGGTTLATQPVRLTTGNNLTASLMLQAITRALDRTGRSLSECHVAVVGAAGSIGRVCAILLGRDCRRLTLLGSSHPGSIYRLERISRQISGAQVSIDSRVLSDVDVVVAAVSAVDAPLSLLGLPPGAVVCDVSIPAAVAAVAAAERPDVTLIRGGIAQLPHGENVGIAGFPLPRGCVYGCMAEAVLLGLEGTGDGSLVGPLRVDNVLRLRELGTRHGIELAETP